MEELRMNYFIQSEKRLSEKQVLDVMGYQGRIIAKQKKKTSRQAGRLLLFQSQQTNKQQASKLAWQQANKKASTMSELINPINQNSKLNSFSFFFFASMI